MAQPGKLSAEAYARLMAAPPAGEDAVVPVFIVLKGAPQRALFAQHAMSAAREATLNRSTPPNEIALAHRQAALAEAERLLAPEHERIETLLLNQRAARPDRFARYASLNMITAEVTRDAIALLEADDAVERVFVAKTRRSMIANSVPSLGAPAFWNAGFVGGPPTTVALIDTGIRLNHPAFLGQTIISRIFLTFGRGSACFADDVNSADDQQGHGTHIAGIIASRGSTGFENYLGVAKGLGTLYNIKAAYVTKTACAAAGSAEADDRDLTAAIQWAETNTLTGIVSLSFGTDVTAPNDDDDLALLVDQLLDDNQGFMAVAAGNSGPTPNTVSSPAIAYNVVAVGNWASRGTMSTTSSRGPTNAGRFKPDIAAPGSAILSAAFNWDAANQADFVTKSGTSMATPHIAGAAALLYSAGITDPVQMKAILINTVDDAAWAADRGWGYANLTTAQPQLALRDSKTLAAGGSDFYRVATPGQLSATLVWNRHFTNSVPSFNNLDLYAYGLASGAQVGASASLQQNVEKVVLSSASDVVVKVRSINANPAAETYAIAISKAFSRVTPPSLAVSCSQPGSAAVNLAFSGSCTVTNNGALPAFSVTLSITQPSGAVAQWSLGTIQPGANAVQSTSLASNVTGANVAFPVAATSAAYGETFSGSSSFSITITGAGGAPGAPANPNPADGATGIASAGTLSWTSSNATSYAVYLGTSNPPPLYTSGLTSASLPFSGLSANTTYFWQVRATNGSGATIGAVWRFTTGSTNGLLFVPVSPCRLVDTRQATGALGGPALVRQASRTFPLATHGCVSPANPAAYSLNITVVPLGSLGFLTVWPTGQTQPVVSTLNALDGRVKANAAIVPAGTSGSIDVFVTDATHLVVDINGYFISPASAPANALAYYPVTPPCRVSDTRNSGGVMTAGSTRTFAVTGSACNIPSTAQAFALNATVVPQTSAFGFLTLWPTGQSQPVVSTLNAVTGTVTANAAIVPAGTSGQISAFVTDPAHLILDINGYFAPAGANGALLFRTVTPCRMVDTRNATGPYGGPILAAQTARTIYPPSSPCNVSTTALAYSLNATVIPPAPFGYLTIWPVGFTQPVVSTLNAVDGALTSNAALVAAPSPGGSIQVLGSDATHLLIDISGYFAP